MFSFDQTSAARERNNTFGLCGVPKVLRCVQGHDRALKLYTIYSPPTHPDGTVHKTKAGADAAEWVEHR